MHCSRGRDKTKVNQKPEHTFSAVDNSVKPDIDNQQGNGTVQTETKPLEQHI